MKLILWIVLIVAVTILFGTIPLAMLGWLFNFIGGILTWLAKILNFFGFSSGILSIGLLVP